MQQDTHWQLLLSGSGVLKAEENGKIVVLTDLAITSTTVSTVNIHHKDALGTSQWAGRAPANDTATKTWREGIEGAAYDGSNAGDLHCEITGGANTIVSASGYMRDA